MPQSLPRRLSPLLGLDVIMRRFCPPLCALTHRDSRLPLAALHPGQVASAPQVPLVRLADVHRAPNLVFQSEREL